MKKNIMMRVASALLIAVLLTTCAISGTFAKYVSTVEGSDSARVAKWEFTFGGNTLAQTNDFSFDLFSTVMDSNGTDAETDIAATDGSIIAPGTSGSFSIDLVNSSEVNAQYKVDFTTVTAGVPLEFNVNNNGWTSTLTDIDFVAIDMDETATISVQWRWVFNGDATVDTTLGLAGTATPSVNAVVTVEQVD